VVRSIANWHIKKFGYFNMYYGGWTEGRSSTLGSYATDTGAVTVMQPIYNLDDKDIQRTTEEVVIHELFHAYDAMIGNYSYTKMDKGYMEPSECWAWGGVYLLMGANEDRYSSSFYADTYPYEDMTNLYDKLVADFGEDSAAVKRAAKQLEAHAAL
jgi:hypothetical protein